MDAATAHVTRGRDAEGDEGGPNLPTGGRPGGKAMTGKQRQAEAGRRALVQRWTAVRNGTAAEGILGKRNMDTAGDFYVPTNEAIVAAGRYRGKVNPDVDEALRRGDFSATTVQMVALDVMKKWRPRTQEAKQVAMKQFMGFLEATGRKRKFFPEKRDVEARQWIAPTATAEEQTLCEFAVMRVMAGAAPDTAGGTVSNVRTWCELMMDRTYGRVGTKAKASLTSEYLKAMKVSMYYPEEDSKDHRRAPVTWPMAEMMVRAAKASGQRDMGVAVAIAFAGLFRMGELTSTETRPFNALSDLSERHLDFHPSFWTATAVTVHIGRTKADQSGKRGKLRPRILPVKNGSPAQTMRDLIARRYGLARGESPILRAVPLLQNNRGGYLSRDSVMRFMRKTMKAAGWTEERTKEFGTHSCRIGGCTALFAMGATAEEIKHMGGWSSDAYKAYLRMQQLQLLSLSNKMCGG